jgi:hypothetical protein
MLASLVVFQRLQHSSSSQLIENPSFLGLLAAGTVKWGLCNKQIAIHHYPIDNTVDSFQCKSSMVLGLEQKLEQ